MIRGIRLLQGLAAAAILSAGMSPGSAVSAETITLWTFLNPNGTTGREVALKNLIDQYETSHPGVDVVVEPQVWSELTKKFVLGNNIRKAPDVVFTHGNNLRLLAESGAAADLDAGVVSKWSDKEKADFLYDSLLEKARINGKLLGVPVFPFAAVLFYRKDLVEQAGFSAADLKTWDGFVKVMKAVDKGPVSGMTIPLSPDRPTQNPLLAYLLDEQGTIFGDNCAPEFATPAGVKALEFQASLFGKGGIASREDVSRNLDDSWDLFLSGRAASIMNASPRAGQVASKASWDGKNDLGIAPLPGIKAGKAGPSVVNAWYVSVWDRSPHKAAAMDFANYLVGEDGARAWALTGLQPPIRKSVLEDPAMDAPKYALLKQVGVAISAASVNLPAKCRVDRVYSDLNEATQKVIVNGVAPMEALKEAEAATRGRQ